jgi:predicted small lipoprotein YifL
MIRAVLIVTLFALAGCGVDGEPVPPGKTAPASPPKLSPDSVPFPPNLPSTTG